MDEQNIVSAAVPTPVPPEVPPSDASPGTEPPSARIVAPQTPEEREAETGRIAAMGLKRFEREAAIKQRIKARTAGERALGKQAMEQGIKKVKIQKTKKKQFRTMMRTRDQEIIVDKIRRDTIFKEAQELQAERTAKQKKDQAYLQELHEIAQIKILEQQRQNRLKADKERDKTKAEYEHRAKVQKAEQTLQSTRLTIERDLHARKTGIDNDARQKAYQLEAWSRMHEAALDTENRNLLSDTRGIRTYEDITKHKDSIEGTMRAKRHRLEVEIKDRRQAIDFEERTKKSGADTDAQVAKAQAEADYRHAIKDADRELGHQLEDIENKYSSLIHDRS